MFSYYPVREPFSPSKYMKSFGCQLW